MDIQILLVLILIILSINLIAVTVYVLFILKEFRETVRKANLVLDDVHDMTDAVASPVTSIAGILAGVTESVKAVKAISSLIDGSKRKKEE